MTNPKCPFCDEEVLKHKAGRCIKEMEYEGRQHSARMYQKTVLKEFLTPPLSVN